MVENLEAQMRASLDKHAIYEALMRYCRGVDRGDNAMLASAYHADGIDDHGFWKGLGSDFAIFINDMLADPEAGNCQHMVTNVLIELDGDVAFVESYVEAVLDAATRREVVHGRYLDRFERRDGDWRIAYRRVVRDMHRVEPQSPLYTDEQLAVRSPGRRDRNDPSYAIHDLGGV